MTTFISYSRRDAQVVRDLARRIEDFDHPCFYDADLRGGQDWWNHILAEIRDRPAFVFVVSPDSVRSRACKAELWYAAVLGKHIVPVMVRRTPIETAPTELQRINFLNFVNPGDREIGQLDTALDEAEIRPWPALPDPMPLPPPIPVPDLGRVRSMLNREELTADEQRTVLIELKTQIQDPDNREAVVAVLEGLAAHRNLVKEVADETSQLLLRYRTPADDARSRQILRSIGRALARESLVPILGSGMNDWLVGSRQDLAQQWAREHDYPLHLGRRDDLPQVAQYISVTTTIEEMREDLGLFYRRQLRRRFPDVVTAPVDSSGRVALDEAANAVWSAASRTTPVNPHSVVASLPCKVFVSAEPTTLLSEALRAAGKSPEEDFCRWSPEAGADWPESPFVRRPTYRPTVEEPLVFNIFGSLEFPDSVVVTEDDYFDVLHAVAEEPDLVPTAVSGAISDSSLLFLGFGLQDWDVRVLMRALISREIAEHLGKYRHVAAEVGRGDDVVSLEGNRAYMEEYFGAFRSPKIDIYWASVEAFCESLEATWQNEARKDAGAPV